MNSRRRKERRNKVVGEFADIPTFARLAVRFGGDPCQAGPPREEWQDWVYEPGLYDFDPDDLKYSRTPTMREMHAHIPTGAWPAIGDPHGTSGERQVAPA